MPTPPSPPAGARAPAQPLFTRPPKPRCPPPIAASHRALRTRPTRPRPSRLSPPLSLSRSFPRHPSPTPYTPRARRILLRSPSFSPGLPPPTRLFDANTTTPRGNAAAPTLLQEARFATPWRARLCSSTSQSTTRSGFAMYRLLAETHTRRSLLGAACRGRRLGFFFNSGAREHPSSFSRLPLFRFRFCPLLSAALPTCLPPTNTITIPTTTLREPFSGCRCQSGARATSDRPPANAQSLHARGKETRAPPDKPIPNLSPPPWYLPLLPFSPAV